MIDGPGGIEWPVGLREHLLAFRQGSLVEQPPFTYHANTNNGVWTASRAVATPSDDQSITLDAEDRPAYGLIVTQTCDVEGKNADKKPWVQVAPVYELPEDDSRLPNVRRWGVHYLAPVPQLGENWVADLRIEMPIEKSWLLNRDHHQGFTTDNEYDKLADLISKNRSRPGFADSVYEKCLDRLTDYLKELLASSAVLYDEFEGTTQALYLAVAGDVLNPDRIQLVFVAHNSFSEGLVNGLESWWASIDQDSLEFDVLPNRYLTLDTPVPLREVRSWYELDHRRIAGS